MIDITTIGNAPYMRDSEHAEFFVRNSQGQHFFHILIYGILCQFYYTAQKIENSAGVFRFSLQFMECERNWHNGNLVTQLDRDNAHEDFLYTTD